MPSNLGRRRFAVGCLTAWLAPRFVFGQEAMLLPYASFLGVRVSTATKRELFNASMNNDAYRKEFSLKDVAETIEFHPGKFPGGITRVELLFTPGGQLIQAIAKVPRNGFGERRSQREERYASVLNSLVAKYGEPNKTGDNKTEFGVYPKYTWLFSDGSAIVLTHKGPVYGMDLMYANVGLYKSNKTLIEQTKKGNI